MPVMTRVALVLFVALFGACAPDEEPAADPTAQALAAVEDRLGELESEVATAESADDDAARDLDRLGERLSRALDRLKGSIGKIRTGSNAGADQAASALAAVHAVQRGLDVLEERYEYHLRRYHGGN